MSPAAIVPFREFVDDYFRGYFSFYPSEGTAAGFHEYDTKLEDFSAVRMRSGRLSCGVSWRSGRSPQAKTASEDEIDAAILDGKIRAELLDIDTIRWWRRNAIPYVTVRRDRPPISS